MQNIIFVSNLNRFESSRIDQHYHPHWEILYYIKGHGHVQFNGYNIDFEPSTTICIPPNTPHVDFSEGSFFNYNLYAHNFPISTREPIAITDFQKKNILRIILLISNEYRAGGSVTVMNSLASALFEQIVYRISSNYLNPQILEIRNSILANYANPNYNITDTLKGCDFSLNYSRKLFTEAFGTTPIDFLQNLRLNKACELLSASTYSISTISEMCGYSDQFYFSKIFKKNFALSPSEWRKTHPKSSMLARNNNTLHFIDY